MVSFQLITGEDYVKDLVRKIKAATRSVHLISMVIADDIETHELIESVLDAAHRGLDVQILADVFTYGEVTGGFLPFVRYYNKNARRTNQMTKRLRAAGVHFRWLGRSRVSIFSGRTHSKWSVVDDETYAFGGINMYQAGIYNVDYMLRSREPALADFIRDEHVRIKKADRSDRPYKSHRHLFDSDTVYIDGGIIGDSIIYRRVCQLAKQADSVVFVSQYCPSGRLARILDDKQAVLYFNRPSNASFLNKLVITYGMLVSGLTSHYTKAAYLHAKLMIFTMPGGSKIAMTGSHNFANSGVFLGTREIALETANPVTIGQLEAFISDEIR